MPSWHYQIPELSCGTMLSIALPPASTRSLVLNAHGTTIPHWVNLTCRYPILHAPSQCIGNYEQSTSRPDLNEGQCQGNGRDLQLPFNQRTLHHLNQMKRYIWTWCLEREISIHAEHIPGIYNTVADAESRMQLEPSDWRLKPLIFAVL